jgi:hypothetical protein
MNGMKRGLRLGALAMTVWTVAACGPTSTPPPPPPQPPRPVAVVIPPRPLPPLAASPNVVPPPVGANGLRHTVNTGNSAAQTTWNFRAAYNVAALNCLQPQHAEILPGYREFLRKHARALTAANSGVDREFRARFGAAFVHPRESYMTQVYNFYAFPPTVSNFCDAALVISREAQLVPVGGLDAFSAQALPRLDQVFLNFYQAYDQYRLDAAAWDARYAPTTPPAPPVAVAVPPAH